MRFKSLARKRAHRLGSSHGVLRMEALEDRRMMAIADEAVHFLHASGYFSMVERFPNPSTNPLNNPIPTGTGVAVAQLVNSVYPNNEGLHFAVNEQSAPFSYWQEQSNLGYPEKQIVYVPSESGSIYGVQKSWVAGCFI
jgi:hypothetical protein